MNDLACIFGEHSAFKKPGQGIVHFKQISNVNSWKQGQLHIWQMPWDSPSLAPSAPDPSGFLIFLQELSGLPRRWWNCGSSLFFVAPKHISFFLSLLES